MSPSAPPAVAPAPPAVAAPPARAGAVAALGALALALLLALVGEPGRTAGPSAGTAGPGTAAPSWAAAVEAGADHVEPRALLRRLASAPGSTLLIDVRPADEHAALPLVGSVNLDLPRLLGGEGAALLAAHPDALVVLVSEGMTHAAQAWVELVRRGGRDVRVLEGGLSGLVAGLLTPPALRGGLTAEAARAAWAEHALALEVFLGRTAGDLPAAPGRFASDPERLERLAVVSAAWVGRRGAAIVLLDTREKPEAYAAGHLPGALHLPIGRTRATRAGVGDELLEPAALAALVGSLGIGPDTEVVAYGDDRLQDPAHAVLALATLGHRRAAVLEGGIGAWRGAGFALEMDPVEPRAAVSYPLPPAPPGFAASAADVLQASRSGAVALLDVRPPDAFRGDVPSEGRAGHVPGALNREFKRDTVVAGGTWWRPEADLRAAYEALGLPKGAPVIVACRTGHQAAQTWFTLRVLLGHADVRWYDGSWKEWAGRPDLPAETGPGRRMAP